MAEITLARISADLHSLVDEMKKLGHHNASAEFKIHGDGALTFWLSTNGEKAFVWRTQKCNFEICGSFDYESALRKAEFHIATKLEPTTEISCAAWFEPIEGVA